ncbi:aspartyl-phosphate phosphatase Spo0E family protein [Thalassobacillus pellis]|uniref:aspartyl-phosphate phosphatase Spo0E family protein n=1 Tax=Thalassobacillus pellis TaxID=748008 RepID=UPI0019602DAE|nr:aspartyl-phosphate phosphatase Spo0E family protein [Thalassobacillus pellis]MBM7554142.1 hypothetical protein [Thalassobacillus pellis]
MDRKNGILIEIEKCREEMNAMSKKLALSSKEVVSISKQLDDLLNKYQNAK